MKTRLQQAFTRFDLIVLLLAAVLGIVFFTGFPMLTRPRGAAQASRIHCIRNLKQIGLGFRMWSNDHNDRFPFQVSTNEGGTMELTNVADIYQHFAAISNELVAPKVLTCPKDTTRSKAISFSQFGQRNLSYFVGLDATEDFPNQILSGDRNITGGGTTYFRMWTASANQDATKIEAGWGKDLHEGQGNIGLADGSAQQLTPATLQRQIFTALQSTQAQVRLLVPPK